MRAMSANPDSNVRTEKPYGVRLLVPLTSGWARPRVGLGVPMTAVGW